MFTVTLTGSRTANVTVQYDTADGSASDGDDCTGTSSGTLTADGVALDPQPTSVEEGESVKIAVMPVDKDDKVTTADEALKIALASSGSADARDFRLSAPIEILAGQNNSNVVDLIRGVGRGRRHGDARARRHGVREPANGTETKPVAGVPTLDITDTTDKRIAPKSQDDAYPLILDPMKEAAGDDGLNPGESFMFAMDDLFTLMDGYTAVYDASGDSSAVSISERGDVVTITAEEAGTSKVTITGTASMASSSFLPSQTVSNSASITFGVEVVDKPLMVEVSTDPMGTVEEGGILKVMATSTTRAVLPGEEAVVMLTLSGPVEGDMERSITITSGETMGYVDLMVSDHDMVSAMGDIVITASGPGITGAQVVTVAVSEDDMETTFELSASAESVVEGDEVTITATASQNVTADTTITLELGAGDADGDDYTVGSIAIMAGSDSGMATLMATDDEAVEGDESLTLNGMMGNVLVDSVMLTITDNDMAPPGAAAGRAHGEGEGRPAERVRRQRRLRLRQGRRRRVVRRRLPVRGVRRGCRSCLRGHDERRHDRRGGHQRKHADAHPGRVRLGHHRGDGHRPRERRFR